MSSIEIDMLFLLVWIYYKYKYFMIKKKEILKF